MDTIFISELRLDILIGVYDWERQVPQAVQFDIELGIPGRRAAHSDRLDDTIDYAAVTRRIEASLRENHFGLLERVAEHIAELIDREFGAPWVKVTVTKLAPLKNVKRLGVTIERGSRQ
ncbi:MAG: dihydroneopterin aldolase [Betaproteobacteria bacterium]|jgi:dihydroneopterin aldolase|nr:MAG: dihydroneopterin aldolase [Betaproteobacteria bacterium]